MIASAISSAFLSVSFVIARSTPERSDSIGSLVPINPVEQTTTSPAFSPNFSATYSAVLCVSAKPSGPVHAFAPPLLRITAVTSLSFTTSRDHVTGAAWILFDVKTAVPYFCGPLFIIRAKSRFPELLIPAATPAPLKPCGNETIIELLELIDLDSH